MNMITSSEAAKLLGVSPGAIRQMVLAGKLRSEKIAGRSFFKVEDVEAMKDRLPPGRPKRS